MPNIIHEFRQNRLRGNARAPIRDNVPRVRLPDDAGEWIGGRVFLTVTIVTTIVTYIILSWMNANDGLNRALGKGIFFGCIATGVYYLAPLLRVLGHMLWHG